MNKILIVDDEEHALKILLLHLKSANYDVISATDGLEALEILKKDRNIDLVVLDNMMPKMDGIKLLKHIKQENSTLRHIGVIMQTAKIQQADIYEGLEAGAVSYITKPYAKELLLATVASVLKDSDAAKEYAIRRMMS